ncbi:MAG: carbonic anhydrase [Saprospiraceae bacterium]|nr:carbonic anhydrase [Saprospiraceae bacterium]MBK6813990.1 carbonic anhydrase [Saprospiraceae bacterium]MBK7437100.1 carbonic anhydrase [Saprospiraceae bacterium]MBK8283101.1 carbonic anhydrase [Saprospiraceae bacterium]MBK8512867.1 carbonic anhydrase [Saprospiraceae bacterium]
MITYEEVFENNKRFIEEKKRNDKEFFSQLSLGQNPEFLYIGCSDSRVTAEEMTGVKPGQMFVHRNIANLVSNNDLSALSVIEYAVDYLQVKHIVVCGHYYCGGVKAAMQSKDLGLLNPWLRNIRDVFRLHQSELEAITDEETRYKRLVEINVEEQCFNVIKTAVVQKHYLAQGSPTVHGWVFDVHSGRLIDLQIDFVEKLKMIRRIYDLGVS